MAADTFSRRPSLGTLLSIVALIVSGFTLWEGTLKQAKISMFVPAVAHYAAPYNNSNFEVFAIPVTLVKDGARTATVMSLDLTVTDRKNGAQKRFYAADFGRWSMERTRAGTYQPFAPISLAGKTSRTESVLFYTRGDSEKPDQIVREIGTYGFELSLNIAETNNVSAFLRTEIPAPLKFDRDLRVYDARAFNTATLPMVDPAFQATGSSTASLAGSSSTRSIAP